MVIVDYFKIVVYFIAVMKKINTNKWTIQTANSF